MRTTRAGTKAAAVAAPLGAWPAGCIGGGLGGGTGSGAGRGGSPAGGARKVLADPAVKGRTPGTAHARKESGAAWRDTGHDSCDTPSVSAPRRAIEAFAELTRKVATCAK